MKPRIELRVSLLALSALALFASATPWRSKVIGEATSPRASGAGSAETLAPTPPMGWNSWDSFGTTITEPDFKANAQWFAEHLKSFGWQYVVVDMEWFVTNPTPEGNSKTSQYSLDDHGR